MSWQSYVDDHLIGTGHVTQGAICGVDGALWAASEGFNVRVPPDLERWMLLFIRWTGRSDAPPLPPARAGFPRGGAEDRGGHGGALRSSGRRRLRGRREVHVPPVRRPHGGGQEGAFRCARDRVHARGTRTSRDPALRDAMAALATPRASRSPSPRPAPTSSPAPPPPAPRGPLAAAPGRARRLALLVSPLIRVPPVPPRREISRRALRPARRGATACSRTRR